MEYNKEHKRGDRNGQMENGVPACVIRRRSPGSIAYAEGGALSFLPEKGETEEEWKDPAKWQGLSICKIRRRTDKNRQKSSVYVILKFITA